jgi:hypothetical protein
VTSQSTQPGSPAPTRYIHRRRRRTDRALLVPLRCPQERHLCDETSGRCWKKSCPRSVACTGRVNAWSHSPRLVLWVPCCHASLDGRASCSVQSTESPILVPERRSTATDTRTYWAGSTSCATPSYFPSYAAAHHIMRKNGPSPLARSILTLVRLAVELVAQAAPLLRLACSFLAAHSL